MKTSPTTRLIRHCIAAVSLLAALVFLQSASAQVIVSDPSLPVLYPAGQYTNYSATPTFIYGGNTIVLSSLSHEALVVSSRVPVGPNEIEGFSSQFNAILTVVGLGNAAVTATGPVQTEVFGYVGNTTGTFNTEMLSMNLSGNSPFGVFMIRESPTLASIGQTTVANLGGGLYQVDSFFDVFTELSLDGGQTWLPDIRGPELMTLGSVPEPSSGALVAIFGGLLMMGRVWHKRA